jgi:NAD(P)-dependent dehydrogenase (short-subunit alcohol dehydrogenase family)
VTGAEAFRYLAKLFDLSGRVGIVTGGGAGIGRSMCLALGRCGVSVVVADKAAAAAQETVRLLEAEDGRGIAIETDVSDPGAVSAMTAVALDRYGRVDILVNNAGINRPAPAEEMRLEDWRAVLEVNLTGVFLCSQAVGRGMIRQGGGAIVNVASIYGEVGNPLWGVAAYAASKGGVVNLTRALAVEWAPYRVRVNAIAPGYTWTDLTRARLEDPEYWGKICEMTPLGCIGVPDDLVGGLLYLASPAAAMVTGHILHIDGGWLAR